MYDELFINILKCFLISYYFLFSSILLLLFFLFVFRTHIYTFYLFVSIQCFFIGNPNQYALEFDCRFLARICYTTLVVSGILVGTICLGILLWAPNTSGKIRLKKFYCSMLLFICIPE